jgi:hypothetical protein
MHIISYTTETALRIKGLFQGNCPVPTRLWAILDGTIQGRILVDEPSHPTFALVQDLTEGTAYLGGVVTPPILRDAFAVARSYQDTVTCLWSDDPLISALPAGRSYEGVAIDFTNRSSTVDLDRLAILPPGYQIKRITKPIFDTQSGAARNNIERGTRAA